MVTTVLIIYYYSNIAAYLFIHLTHKDHTPSLNSTHENIIQLKQHLLYTFATLFTIYTTVQKSTHSNKTHRWLRNKMIVMAALNYTVS